MHWRRRPQGTRPRSSAAVYAIRTDDARPLQYERLFEDLAGIGLEKYDEIDCTILGLNFLLTTLSDEVYTFEVRLSPLWCLQEGQSLLLTMTMMHTRDELTGRGL